MAKRRPARREQLALPELVRMGSEALSAELGHHLPGKLPPAVTDRLARLLGDRLPCSGVLRLRCPGCQTTRAVGFRCLGECDLCPRRANRRAASLARLIPRVPVRHWVLALPRWLRSYLAHDEVLATAVARLFMRELFVTIRRCSGQVGSVHCGGVTLVHRAGAALNVNVHVHALVLDGVYTVPRGESSAVFHPLAQPPDREAADALVRRVLAAVRTLVLRRMKSGALPGAPADLQRLESASVIHRVATGPRAGAAVRRVRGTEVSTRRAPSAPAVRSERGGLKLHGGRQVAPREREAVLRLSRYVTRPPVDLDALTPTAGGRIRYELEHPFHDGTTHVELEPQELAEKLVALIPEGATHRVSYHGVLAPRAAHRWRVLPTQLMLIDHDAPPRRRPAGKPTPPAERERLLHCENCDRPMQVVSVDEAVDDPG